MLRWTLWLLAGAGTLHGAELLVLNKEDASLVFVDTGSGKITGRAAVGEGPHELVLSSDGKLAFASNYGTGQRPGSTISVVDTAARKELRRVDVSPLGRPHGLWWHDGRLYFTSEANKIVGRYDPASNRVDWMLGTGQNSTHMVRVSDDGGRIYTANIGSDTITVFERSGSNWNATVVPVGKGPEGFDISPDGKQLWAAHSRDGGISVIDLDSKKVVRTIPAGTKRSNRLKFTADGTRVLISDLEGGELVVLDAASGREVKRLALGKAPEGILIHGGAAYVAVNGDNFIAVVDLKTLEVKNRLQPGNGPDGMAMAGAR